MQRNGPKSPTALRGPLGIQYHQKEKASMTDFLENTFTSFNLCEKWRLEARKCRRHPFEKVRSCVIEKLINAFKLRKVCGIDDIPNELSVEASLTEKNRLSTIRRRGYRSDF
jgi:hypothetical protein